MSSLLTAFGLGFLYFISAIPAGVALGAPVWPAAAAAWLGYSAGGALILLLGVPAQEWLRQKWKFSFTPDPQKLFWRIFDRYGVIGLGLIAPITIGPQLTALLLLTLGIKPQKIFLAIALGVIPWTILFVGAIQSGFHFLKSP
ncbi:MAG: small multi-drug export protein [Chthoniobacterales bacterium]|nr:small multi-drug export protein [Chthoniobacterales bacterium]